MEGPAEFWENVALQMTEANTDGSAGAPYTTQLVIADLLRKRGEGNTENGETHNYTYGDYENWGESGSFSTSTSDNFDQRGEGEETLQMSGGIVKKDEEGNKTLTGTVTAVGDGYTLRITASMETVEYSVGFQRRDETANEALPALYLDCRKEVLYYSVDLILPDDATNFVVAPNGTDEFILFFTWTNSVSGGDFNLGIERGEDTASGGTTESQTENAGFTWTQLSKLAQIEDGQDSADALTFNGATVIGYHFNHLGVPCTQVVNNQPISGTTIVRINKRFTFSEDGKQVTGSTDTYSHVATIQENEGQYPHLMNRNNDGSYTCTGKNPVTISADNIKSLSPDINVGDFVYQKPDATSPYDSPNDYTLASEKGYTLSFGVTFIQANELPADGTSTRG